MAHTIEDLEMRLGPPSEFVIGDENKRLVRQWAILKGHNPIDVNVMTSVALANLYHASAAEQTPKPDAAALTQELFIKIMRSVTLPGFNVGLMEQIAADHWAQKYNDIGEEIRKQIEALPPKRLDIYANGQPVARLDGPMHYKTERCIRIAARGHHIMMVGPAGCGKTTIGNHIAAALNLPCYITSTITSEHQLTGFVDGYGNYHPTPFRAAFEHGGVWIADEIDAWDAAALLAANAALANGIANFPDRPQPIQRHANFRMVATANTFGNGADRVYIGRNELDAASLDRFAVVEVDYDLELEKLFSNGNTKWLAHVWKVREAVNEKKIRHVVSSRAIAMGAVALADGDEWREVNDTYLYKGMSANDRKKIADTYDNDIPF